MGASARAEAKKKRKKTEIWIMHFNIKKISIEKDQENKVTSTTWGSIERVFQLCTRSVSLWGPIQNPAVCCINTSRFSLLSFFLLRRIIRNESFFCCFRVWRMTAQQTNRKRQEQLRIVGLQSPEREHSEIDGANERSLRIDRVVHAWSIYLYRLSFNLRDSSCQPKNEVKVARSRGLTRWRRYLALQMRHRRYIFPLLLYPLKLLVFFFTWLLGER